MHPSQDNQEGLEVPSRTIEPHNRRDLAGRDRDYHQHEPSQQPVPTQHLQTPYSLVSVQLGPEPALTSRRPAYSPPPVYGYPSQPVTTSTGREPGRRPHWLEHTENDTGDPTLDLNRDQHHSPPAWPLSPPSPPIDPKTGRTQRRHPYRAVPFTSDHRRGYQHPRHSSPQEQRPPPPQEQIQPSIHHLPYHQQPQIQQQHQPHYDQVLSREYMTPQGHQNEAFELGRQQQRQAGYNRDLISIRYDPHGMHYRTIHSGHGASPPQPPLDVYGHHHRQHHPPSPYHPHSARPPNRTFSPPNLFARDSSHRPRSPNGEGTSPPPGETRSVRVDRHSSLPNMESEAGYPPHADSSHTRPYLRASGEIPGPHLAVPLDPRGSPYYPEGLPHDLRAEALPHWANHPLHDPRYGDYFRRGYEYRHDHLYETQRRSQVSFGIPSHGFAAWEQGGDGYHPPLHHRSPWPEHSPPPSWARRHSADTLGGAPTHELEDQRRLPPSEQDREEGGEEVNSEQSRKQDSKMEDRTETDNSKTVAALDSPAPDSPALGLGQPRTPNISENSLAKSTQHGITEGKRRAVPGLVSSPSMSSSTASISTDGPPSTKDSVASRISTTTVTRLHQSLGETHNESRKGSSLSPSLSLHFTSLSPNPTSSTSPRTLPAVSPSLGKTGAGAAAAAVVSPARRQSNSGIGTNSAGSGTTVASEPVAQLGQEGYYSKRDLEELYKSWQSNFEEKERIRALPRYSPHRQYNHHHHFHSPRQHSRLGTGKDPVFLAGGGKDAAEERLFSERRKVKWKTVEFAGGLGGPRQEGGGGGEGSSGEYRRREPTAMATTNKREFSRGSGDKRARLDPSQEASDAAATGETLRRHRDARNVDRDMDEDAGDQEEQDYDENEDDDEEGLLSEDDNGSTSAGDPGSSSDKAKGSTRRASAGVSSSTPDGQPRRVRVQESKSHQCDKCEKKFSRPSQLQTHSFTHSGEKPHECPHCKRLFNVASNLKRHIRIHSNNKRRSSRNGNVVFRSFAQGTHVTQMVTGTIGGGSSSGSGFDPNDPNKRAAAAPSPRTTSFDRLRWMNTETPTKGLTVAQQMVHMASYRPIKAKTGAAAAAAASAAATAGQSSSSTTASSPSSMPAPVTPSPSTTPTTTRATSVPASSVTPAAAVSPDTLSTTTISISSTTPTAVTPTTTPSSGSGTSGSSVSSSNSTSTTDTSASSLSSALPPPLSSKNDVGDLNNSDKTHAQQQPLQHHEQQHVPLPSSSDLPPLPPLP
ncbi:MAG: hypothetical protein J3R72DRAFT_454093 [Linnemannia gamsii]|nr:MAG: hypothetical protein J3R72DRAFT_454093 [Linnemannia gamsii]